MNFLERCLVLSSFVYLRRQVKKQRVRDSVFKVTRIIDQLDSVEINISLSSCSCLLTCSAPMASRPELRTRRQTDSCRTNLTYPSWLATWTCSGWLRHPCRGKSKVPKAQVATNRVHTISDAIFVNSFSCSFTHGAILFVQRRELSLKLEVSDWLLTLFNQ